MTSSITKRAPKPDYPLPYSTAPNLFESEDPRCWLRYFFEDQAKAEALRDMAQRTGATVNSLERDALRAAETVLFAEVNRMLRRVVETGGLLYAWAGTTVLSGAPA